MAKKTTTLKPLNDLLLGAYFYGNMIVPMIVSLGAAPDSLTHEKQSLITAL